MGKKKKYKCQQKNERNQAKVGRFNAEAGPAYSFDYDRFRQAVVDAIKEIKKDEQEDNFEAFENDHMSKNIVELLDLIFVSAMVILFLFLGGSVLLPFFDGVDTKKGIICWVISFSLFTIVWLEDRIKKRGKLRGWFKCFVFLMLFLFVVALIVALHSSIILLLCIGFACMVTVMLKFCWFARIYIRQEYDRAFLVSYFSAITGIAALIVSVITLIVTIYLKD